MADDEAAELAQRLCVLIGMIMEDVIDGAIATAGGNPAQLQMNRLRRTGDDIMKVAAAAEVVLRRYGGFDPSEVGASASEA